MTESEDPSPAVVNLTEAQEAAAQFAVAFPGCEAKPAMQMLSEGAYLYVRAVFIRRAVAQHAVSECRAREARRMLAKWQAGEAVAA